MSLNRRDFLKLSAASGLALPFLESLEANAQSTGVVPPRVIFLTTPHGHFHKEFFPQNPVGLLVGPEGMKYAPLAGMTGPLSNVHGNRFDAFKNKINLIQGLDVLAKGGSGAHAQTRVLCASGQIDINNQESFPVSGYSIDSILAESPTFYKGKPFSPALRLANSTYGYDDFFSFNRSNGSNIRNSYFRKSTSSTGTAPTAQAFNTYFGSLTTTTTTTATPTSSDPQLPRRSAFNQILNSYANLAKSTRLSATDKIQLDQHATIVRNLASKLTTAPVANIPISGQCAKPVLLTTSNSNEQYDQTFDLITAILNCRMTSLVHLSLSEFVDPVTGIGAGQWHQEGGHTENMATYRTIQGWVADRVVSLMKKMDAIKEENGQSMLDNSLIVLLSQHGYENGHQPLGHTALLAGSLGGKIRTGNYLDYRQTGAKIYDLGYNDLGNNTFGRPYNSLMVSIFNALGVPPSEYEREGLVGFGEYNQAAWASYGTPWQAYLTDVAKRASLPLLVA